MGVDDDNETNSDRHAPAQGVKDAEAVRKAELPLTGVVLCCTSLAQDVRTKLAEIACQMGAVHKLDLTSDVTHLLVGDIRTPKYRYVAKERPDISVLKPEWLEAVRELWMEGGDVEMSSLEEQYRLPTFFGLRVCVTGFDNLEQRTLISDTVQYQGAEYHGDLTKQVTHLIANVPQGAKYTHAKEWGIPTVSLRWFEDSLYRKMALDEALYDVAMLEEEQGQGAFRKITKARTSLGKRPRDDEPQNVAVGEAGKRKLRRTASTRLQSQSQDMWQDLSAGKPAFEQTESGQGAYPDGTKGSNVLVTVDTATLEATEDGPHNRSRSLTLDTEEPAGIFAGWYVHITSFEAAKTRLLERFLEPNGATVVSKAADLDSASTNAFFRGRCLLVPHSAEVDLPEMPPGTAVATEWWVERCIHNKRLLQPEDDNLSQPLWNVDVSGFMFMNISMTGFAGVDLRQTAEAVKLGGATYQEKLLPSTSVLISGSCTIRKEKAYYATKHGIPVVSIEWLWDCLRNKRKASFEKYKVQLPAFDPKDIIGEPSTSSPAPSDMMQRKSGDKLKRSDQPSRLSNTRKRHATPSLPLQASKTTPAAALSKAKAAPFVHEDDDQPTLAPTTDSDALPPLTTDVPSPKRSQPLQELSPNWSPRKQSQPDDQADHGDESVKAEVGSKNVDNAVKPISPPTSPTKDLSQPHGRADEDLNKDIASLLAHHKSSRPNTASSEAPPKRKNRPLGRAVSSISNRSNHSSLASAQDTAGVPDTSELDHNSIADGFHTTKEAPAPPSTQLGYETPEAEAHRLAMGKRMGTVFTDELSGKRIASMGVVKDAESLNGKSAVGGRVQRRHRTKT